MVYVTKDIKSLNDYCMTRDRSIKANKGQLKGFSNDPYSLHTLKIIN